MVKLYFNEYAVNGDRKYLDMTNHPLLPIPIIPRDAIGSSMEESSSKTVILYLINALRYE